MTAQPIHQPAKPPRITLEVRDIRKHLTAEHQARFQEELDTAVDSGELKQLDAVKTRWWAQSLIDTDPQLKADLETPLDQIEWLPSPFTR